MTEGGSGVAIRSKRNECKAGENRLCIPTAASAKKDDPRSYLLMPSLASLEETIGRALGVRRMDPWTRPPLADIYNLTLISIRLRAIQ